MYCEVKSKPNSQKKKKKECFVRAIMKKHEKPGDTKQGGVKK